MGRRVIEARVHGRKASSHSWLCPTVHSEVFPCFVPEERKLKLCRLIRFIVRISFFRQTFVARGAGCFIANIL